MSTPTTGPAAPGWYLFIIKLKTVVVGVFKWLKGSPALPVIFSFVCLVLELFAISAEKLAGAFKTTESKVFCVELAICASVITLVLIVLNAVWNYEKSGARARRLETNRVPWFYYGDNDPYNCTPEIISVLICCIQTVVLMVERSNLLREHPKGKRECLDALIIPLIFTVAELVMASLRYFDCTSATQIYCSETGKHIQLKRKANRSTKTFECPGCIWGKLYGNGACILPIHLFLNEANPEPAPAQLQEIVIE